jgi:Metallo-beta-lactamase superfamily
MTHETLPQRLHPAGEQLPVEASAPTGSITLDTFAGPVRVRDRSSPLTPLGQLVYFVEFLKVSGRLDAVIADCPLAYTSPNAPEVRDVIGTWILSILAGHKRYAHITSLRCDDVLRELMGRSGGLLVDGVRDRLRPDLRVHLAAAEAKFWESPDFSRVSMPPGFPDALRRTAKRFLNEYNSQLRPFEAEYEVAPGVLVQRTGGHTPGHSVVRMASGGDRLTFAGDAVFQVGFEHPDWYNGFEHDPEEAARVRVSLLRELAAHRESLVATHLSFPSVCHVAVDGDVFRWVPGPWEF